MTLREKIKASQSKDYSGIFRRALIRAGLIVVAGYLLSTGAALMIWGR